MKHVLTRGTLSLCALVSLSGCIDNNYDLSDIDTTSEFKIKDLIVPINIDPITLGDILDIKEGDIIQEVTIGGQTFYAINEKGSFRSNSVEIPSFYGEGKQLSPAVIAFPTEGTSVPAGGSFTIPLPGSVRKTLAYNVNNVHASIKRLDEIFFDRATFKISFEVQNTSPGVELSLENIMLTIPKGLEIDKSSPSGYYSFYDGKYAISNLQLIDGKAEISISVSKINLPANSCYLENGAFNLTSAFNIENANLKVSSASGISALPSDIIIDAAYTIPDINVKAISGVIEYTFDGSGLDIAPIDLSDVPDFLAGDDTDLVLANPQIYLSVNNPMANLGWDYVSGFDLTAVRANGESKVFSLDSGQIGVGHSKPLGAMYQFRLSPDLNADQIYIPQGYENPEHELFSSLGEVLSGNGLPEKIEINLVNPHLLRQTVTKFLLNTQFPALEGNWEFIAPLALTSNDITESKIVYTHTADGWSSANLDAVTIQILEVSMTVDNDLPLDANLTGYPIDVNGNQIGDVTIEGAVIPANAKDHEVKLYITGEIRHLDGITFSAEVYPTSENPLAPSQTLTLNNIRAKVSGNYIKEL